MVSQSLIDLSRAILPLLNTCGVSFGEIASRLPELTVNGPPARVFRTTATPQGLAHWWTKTSAGEPHQGAEYTLELGLSMTEGVE
jgi:hypothetical protein